MTHRLSTRLAAAALALVLCAAAHAQPRATARVSPTRLGVGGQVAYTLTIEGATGGSFAAPPTTGGLRPTQNRPTSDVVTQVNGQTERELTWTYTAVRPGPARIGPFRFDANGRTMAVAAASVTVTAQAAPSTSAPAPSQAPGERRDLFARVELSEARAVVGQQVVADVVLYFDPKIQPRQTLVTGSWDAPGFWREELEVASTVPHGVTLGGRAYEAVTLRRVALFPTRDGRLELPPMTFSVDFLSLSPFSPDPNDPFAPFFQPFSGGLDQADVSTPAVTLDVSALPAGAPAGFSGAVGQYTMAAAPVARTAQAGEPVQLAVTITGTGNLATLAAPALRTPPGADAFPPRDDSDIDRTGTAVRGTRSFTFTLVPQGGGPLDVPPAIWSYFDPEAGEYRTLRTDSVQVAVSGAAAEDTPRRAAAGPAAGLITEATWQRPGVPVWILWTVLGAGLGIPALALGLAAGVRRRRRLIEADTPENRRRAALATAQTRLAAARTLTGTDACAAAERAVHGFLSDRYQIAATGLDRRALAEALADHSVPESARLVAVLAALDVGQFAPALARTAPAETIVEAETTLQSLDAADRPAPRRVARRAAVAALVLIAATGVRAQGLDEANRLVALGAQLAVEGDSAGAAAAFAGAADAGRAAGRVSAAVEHDLGTLALARGDAGTARLHTERAARLAPLSAPVQQNAALARALAGATPETAIARAWRVARSVAGPTGLVALALALVYVALALFLNARRRAALVVGALGLFAVVGAVSALAEASRPAGVALVAAGVRAEPTPEATEGAALAPGALVRLGERRGTWRAVRTDGRDGWIPDAAVGAL